MNLDLQLWPRGWVERSENLSSGVGSVVGAVGSLRKIKVWMGWGDIEHEMVKLMQHVGVPSAEDSCPLEYQCDL